MTRYTLTIPGSIQEQALAHLFPGDGDEHGLVLMCGIARSGETTRLLVREAVFAKDGVDYVAGKRGYRMLKAEFIHPLIQRCRDERLVYLAVHNHGGFDSVAFSADDLASHERGYPALLDIVGDLPVGALVYARGAIAGDVWLPGGVRANLAEVRVLGANIQCLYNSPPRAAPRQPKRRYVRQVQMFGAIGQERLSRARIGVIGAGGAGSLIIEYLARLGVGNLVVVDNDRIAVSNLSRVVGATRWDTRYPLSSSRAPKAAQQWAARHCTFKVDIAKRLARVANRAVRFEGIVGDFANANVANRFLDCDFLFLAADSMRARLVFNAIVQQYFIPGIQVGTKIVAPDGGDALESAFGVERWVLPQKNCLWCSGMISSHLLAIEAKTEREKADQKYGANVPNPSVVTMNAVVASQAVNDFLLSYLELFDASVVVEPLRFKHLERARIEETYVADPDCPECAAGIGSRMGTGDAIPLPVLASE